MPQEDYVLGDTCPKCEDGWLRAVVHDTSGPPVYGGRHTPALCVVAVRCTNCDMQKGLTTILWVAHIVEGDFSDLSSLPNEADECSHCGNTNISKNLKPSPFSRSDSLVVEPYPDDVFYGQCLVCLRIAWAYRREDAP
jgi:hypothetical protein